MQKIDSRLGHENLTEEERFRIWLQRQHAERCKRNPHYSLRAFAKFLKKDPSSLAKVLSGKISFSRKWMQSVCDKLAPSRSELRSFGLLTEIDEPEGFNQIALDTFSVISDWYYSAIQELTSVRGFNPNPQWIADRLGISARTAKKAMVLLKRVGLLAEKNGTWVRTSTHLTNQSTVATSDAHKNFQRQLIEKALKAVDDCPPEEKDITSMMFAIDPSKLDEARAEIRSFRRRLCGLLEEGAPLQVYNLAIQLYPLSHYKDSK